MRLRATPQDFRVEEVPLYAPTGTGEHTFVQVEKTLRTTEEVARDLARAAGVAPRDVGYAGRKDRVAVATQWLSVPRLAPDAALRLELPGVRVLAASAHPHKLRTGQLLANRFTIAVREVPAESVERARGRLDAFVRSGLPNRFGEQRFGRDRDNAERGRALLRGDLRLRDRRAARFLVSALQSELFNAVLARRADAPGRLLAGDVAVVHASGGLFVVEDLAREAPRAGAFEISPTGPIFGGRTLEPAGEAAELERDAARELGLDLAGLRAPPGVRMRGTRRALRVRPEAAGIEPLADGFVLRCTLPPGSYVTVLVEELLASG